MPLLNIVFVGNYLNHHLSYLCDEFLKQSSSFYFISTDDSYVQGFQKKIVSPYVLYYQEHKEKCDELIIEADLCIFGSCPDEMINERISKGKTAFLYTERFFKKGQWRRFIPSTFKKINNRIIRFKQDRLYILCAGAYVSNDLHLCGFHVEKCLKWGYFPETKIYNNIGALFEKKERASMLWCGRFLKWKHPELAVYLTKRLKKDGYDIKLKMIGDGPFKNKIETMIRDEHLEESIQLCNSLSPKQIRYEMEKTSIYLLTSDNEEGWGAVLNEAMNSGCAVVSSDRAGSTIFLIADKENGVIFRSNNLTDLYNKTKMLIDDDVFRKEIGIKAIDTICKLWNAKIAANRLICINERLALNKTPITIFDSGPCSLAQIIKYRKRDVK